MFELVFPPSPNWYLPSVFCVGNDGCIVYGSCSNHITILTPAHSDHTRRTFNIHVIHVAHKSRVTCIALCPDWINSRMFLSGADDGIVKLWSAETLSFAIAHNMHSEYKETIIGLAFLREKNVVSIGSLGVLVLWNTKQNSVKVDSKLMRSYKPICLSVCPHKDNSIAVGTKQGVVLVLEYQESFKILFKLHGHETEVTSICWCPSTHCEPLEKLLAMKRPKMKSTKVRKVPSKKNDANVKNGQMVDVPEDDKAILNTTEYGLYEQSSGEEADESDIFDVYKERSFKEFGYNHHSDSEKDSENTKYTPSMLLSKSSQSEKFQNEARELDTSLMTAMEAVNLDSGDQNRVTKHNEEFLQACKKMQNIMQSKKIPKTQFNSSILADRSITIGNDSVAEYAEDPLNDSCQTNPADESDIFDVYKEPSFYEFGHSKYIPQKSDNEDEPEKPKHLAPYTDGDGTKESQSADFLEECKRLQEFLRAKKQAPVTRSQDAKDDDTLKKESDKESEKVFNRSTDDANTDDDFLDSSLKNESAVNVADESDIFDIYKEPSFYEFGHSKYVPSQSDNEGENEKPRVKLSSDFLKECAKLKELVGKSDENSSENELSELSSNVKKLELDASKDGSNKTDEFPDMIDTELKNSESNIFLATCCKKGKVIIWRWGGSLVSSGNAAMLDKGKDEKVKKMGHPWGSIFWPTTKLLLTASKSAQLLRCNFHSCYSRSKTFGFSVLHEDHQRGLYAIAASTSSCGEENWRLSSANPTVWSISQDRLLVGYSFDDNKVLSNYTTFGGYIYDIAVSPIDPTRLAIGAGDGMVRVWERGEGRDLTMRHHWQGVQGRVQSVAWHPTRENCLAFSNSEGRVGLIDAGSMNPAKVLPPGLPLGAYKICWGPRNVLFANGGAKLVVYNTNHINRDPEMLLVSSSGKKWGISTVVWSEDYLTVGSTEGQVGILKPEYPYDMISFAVPHRKCIQCIEWHPIAVSSEDGLSPYSDLVAISAAAPMIVIMKLVKEDDAVKLELYEEFTHHRLRVNKLCWSPHHNGRLLSVSHDSAIQIVDVIEKCLLHTLLGHSDTVLCCTWCPVNPLVIISGSEDHSLRVWNVADHPPQEIFNKKIKQKRKMKLALIEGGKNNKVEEIENGHIESPSIESKASNEEQVEVAESNGLFPAEQLARIHKGLKKKQARGQSPLVLLWKQLREEDSLEGCQRLFRLIQAPNQHTMDYTEGYDFLKLFGSYNDVMELLNLEQQKHEEKLNWDGWVMVGLLRGDTKNVLEKAKERQKLCPSLLSIAPSVSHRFWKEMTAAYADQLEAYNHDTCGPEFKCRLVCWRAILLLCSGEVEGACNYLCSAGMAPDAVVIARVRHADHLVSSCLQFWANESIQQNRFSRAAECFLALNEVMEAAAVLGKSNNEADLALAAVMAKYATVDTQNQ